MNDLCSPIIGIAFNLSFCHWHTYRRGNRINSWIRHAATTVSCVPKSESLLESDRESTKNISAAITSEAALWTGFPNLAGDRLGSWRVVKEIGRGGMGTVYLAVRDDDQFQKQVAIKVVRHGMDTADVLGRFRHERQILANLDHPYIARLLDGGTTPDGRPFFVMDYVEGQPLDLFCSEQQAGYRSPMPAFSARP